MSRIGDLAVPLTMFLAASGSAITTDYEAFGLVVTFPGHARDRASF
ncbi:MAG: hypothetical protein KA371_10635 [Acidobacteria bacterium]|nr:hypothetical protein [Acidobacteriota bacterium]